MALAASNYDVVYDRPRALLFRRKTDGGILNVDPRVSVRHQKHAREVAFVFGFEAWLGLPKWEVNPTRRLCPLCVAGPSWPRRAEERRAVGPLRACCHPGPRQRTHTPPQYNLTSKKGKGRTGGRADVSRLPSGRRHGNIPFLT